MPPTRNIKGPATSRYNQGCIKGISKNVLTQRAALASLALVVCETNDPSVVLSRWEPKEWTWNPHIRAWIATSRARSSRTSPLHATAARLSEHPLPSQSSASREDARSIGSAGNQTARCLANSPHGARARDEANGSIPRRAKSQECPAPQTRESGGDYFEAIRWRLAAWRRQRPPRDGFKSLRLATFLAAPACFPQRPPQRGRIRLLLDHPPGDPPAPQPAGKTGQFLNSLHSGTRDFKFPKNI
jgi:hypothetical protein